MMTETYRYSIAEKVSYLVNDLREFYIHDHGDHATWSQNTDEIFYFNCDINLCSVVDENQLHPKAIKLGIGRGVDIIHFKEGGYYDVVSKEDDDDSLTYEESMILYDEMIETIADYIFEYKV